MARKQHPERQEADEASYLLRVEDKQVWLICEALDDYDTPAADRLRDLLIQGMVERGIAMGAGALDG